MKSPAGDLPICKCGGEPSRLRTFPGGAPYQVRCDNIDCDAATPLVNSQHAADLMWTAMMNAGAAL